jgi:hypothetical protein
MSVFWFVGQKSFFGIYWPAKKFPAFVGLKGALLFSQNAAIGPATPDLSSADEVIPYSCCLFSFSRLRHFAYTNILPVCLSVRSV